MYHPRSEATRAAHERLLSVLLDCLAGVELPPDVVLLHLADDVLSVLKDDRIPDSKKKTMIELHVPGPIPVPVFQELVTICDSITDYLWEEEDDALEDDESDEDSDASGGRPFLEDDDGEYSDVPEVNVEEMDAGWLQRQISQAYGGGIGPGRCSELAQRVLEILATCRNRRDAEDDLIILFDHDKFSLVKLLVRYRHEVVARCTPPSAP